MHSSHSSGPVAQHAPCDRFVRAVSPFRRVGLLVGTLWFAAGIAAGCSQQDAAPDAADASVADVVTPGAPLYPEDVSVLFPAPSGPADEGYLLGASEGPAGVLLPRDVFDAIPTFPVKPVDGLVYDRMVVLGVRFDACFPGVDGCEAQVRLVLQPVSPAGLPRDSALHAFYSIPKGDLPAVIAELRRLHTLAPEVKDGTLDVHPALVAQGVTGPYGTALRDLVLRYAGDRNLVRTTFFLRAPPTQEVWFLGGFDRVEGKLQTIDVVGVGKQSQRVIRPETADGYEYQLTPSPKVPEDISVVLSSAAAKSATAEERSAAASALARIENPRAHSVDQLSCAGCHVTSVVRAHLERTHALDVGSLSDAFPARVKTSSKASETPSSLRAFGYFGQEPMVSNRTLHETESVLADIEKRFPR